MTHEYSDDNEPNTASAESKRKRHMSDPGKFQESEAHRDAAAIYATVELAEATAAQTAAITAQTAILERQALAAEALAVHAQHENLLRFYATNPTSFPAGVRDQMKSILGIASSTGS